MKQSNEGGGNEGGGSGAGRGARQEQQEQQEPIAGDAWLLVVVAFLAILMKFFHDGSGC